MYLTRIVLLFLPIAFCSCTAPAARLHPDISLKHRTFAWDGLGHDPNRPRAKVKRGGYPTSEEDSSRTREKAIVSLRPYSAEWWTAHNEIEADNDKRLARKLVICDRCLQRSSQVDVTGTITAD